MFQIRSAALTVVALFALAGADRVCAQERVRDVVYGRKFGMALTMDVWKPAKQNGSGVIFIVSGGFKSGIDLVDSGPFVSIVARPFLDRGYTLFAVCHGAQPKFTVSEIVPDIHRAVRFIRVHAKEYGVNPDRLGIMGGSSGGFLALSIGTSGKPGDQAAKDLVDRASSRVQAVACFNPACDLVNYGQVGRSIVQFDPVKPGGQAFGVQEKPKEEQIKVLRELSPLGAVTKDTPPTLIIHGDSDLAVPYEQSERFIAKLAEYEVLHQLITRKNAGHRWPDMGKDYLLLADWFDKHLQKASAPESVKADEVTRYLAFQIFTYYSPDPKVASQLSSGSREKLLPGTTALRNYVDDIKGRIGTVGDKKTRLAVMLGPLCFEQTDAEVTEFVARAFDLALESDVAVGFHIDDSIFWLRREDLWSDPKNVEALDWDGAPCTGRRLDWSRNPTEAPPQMCFNSKVIEREVQERSTLLGKAIQAGVKRLQERNRPELFAGVIAGWETMLGQDFKTGKYLGYRALLNRGFSRAHPPQDMNLEREKVVQEFIDLWTNGLALAGVSPQQIYSHTAFLSRRAFNLGDDKAITYMKRDKNSAYSQHNHFAPPSVAFGTHHRPGFSTYPQPGLFDDIYEELATHKQVGWASCEGTNMQPSSGPGQTGMGMETYLAKMFNHGATLVNIFAWGIGGDAMKNMDFRVVTEGDEALRAYRKFLKGEALVEARTTASLMERLPPKIHRIQKELPAWIQKADADNKEKTRALMQKLDGQMKAKNFEEVEKTADSILKLMGGSAGRSGAQEAKSTHDSITP